MSSETRATVVPMIDSHGRHTHMCRRVFSAATALLDESDRAEVVDVSVPELAARARVATATATAHFPSTDAVFAELYLHRLHAVPLCVDQDAEMADRVSTQLRAITFVVADEPGLAEACTRALLHCSDPAVAEIRWRIGAEVHRRVTAALGAGAWPEVAATLETVFWGALMQVHSGVLTYDGMATRLDTMLALILPHRN